MVTLSRNILLVSDTSYVREELVKKLLVHVFLPKFKTEIPTICHQDFKWFKGLQQLQKLAKT